MDDQELQTAAEALSSLQAPVELNLWPGSDPDDQLLVALRETVEALASVSGGKLTVQEAPTCEKYPDKPSLTVGNVRYLAVPRGPELAPFLSFLEALSAQGDAATEEPLAPAEVRVYMASTCPNCPVVVGACLELAARFDQLHLEVVDAMVFTDMAGPLKSVPAVVVDGAYTEIGPLSRAELLRILRRRQEPGFQVDALESMISAARLVDALAWLRQEDAFATLTPLLRRSGIKERMGVMLMVEEALEEDPHALDLAVPHLLPLLQAEDPSLRGDTADLLGQIGAPGSAEALRKLLSDDNEDVREVAKDALEMLREPS